jgi:hypothetical protein
VVGFSGAASADSNCSRGTAASYCQRVALPGVVQLLLICSPKAFGPAWAEVTNRYDRILISEYFQPEDTGGRPSENRCPCRTQVLTNNERRSDTRQRRLHPIRVTLRAAKAGGSPVCACDALQQRRVAGAWLRSK